LVPHVEGGHYRRIHTSAAPAGTRPALSAIHFLLRAGESSAWHRVDADEAWHFVEGEALELLIYQPDDDQLRRCRLGPLAEAPNDASAPIQVVPAGAWQAARSLGAYTLCTCLVAPAFDFAGFRLLDDAALAARLRALVPELQR
jgi:predicted cupin superfamily sugar epimerase